MDLITFDLERAFRKEGCPICHLRQDNEARYISSFLWEYVNDPDLRIHLVNALGFCRRHAWQLLETERDKFGGGLGTGIVYEDLAGRALMGLRELGQNHNALPLAKWIRRARRFLRKQFSFGNPRRARLAFPAGLLPYEECRLCQSGRGTEQTHLEWLVKDCASAEFREEYRASDGLCLPHLRTAIEMAQDETTRSFLIETAQEKLGILVQQLEKYLRKQNWEYRNEPITPEEQSSWLRAVEFFVGKK